jgi:hypothetical protein
MKSEFKKFWVYLNKSDNDELQWITVHGAHIPIKPGESKASAVQHAFYSPKKPNNYKESEMPSKKAPKFVAKQLRKVYASAPEAKKHIDDLADTLTEKIGGKVSKTPLKNMERSIEKVHNDYGDDSSKLTDIARNTVVSDNPKMFSEHVEALKGYKGTHKFTLVSSDSDPMGYSGAMFKIKTPNGHTAEMQVNIPHMIYAKEPEETARKILGDEQYEAIKKKTGIEGGKGHKYYEQDRKLAVTDPGNTERKKIQDESKEYYSSIGKHYSS